jgi:hypothetical protein
MLLYQVLKPEHRQGLKLYVATGRKTPDLARAIARAKACNGQVRPYGSLTVLFTFGVQLCGTEAPLQKQRAWWPEPKRIAMHRPRIVNAEGHSTQQAATKYHAPNR